MTRLLPALLWLWLSSVALAAPVALDGEVAYRERIALPADARLTVRLIDITAPIAPIATTEVAPAGQVPIAFTLAFDDAVLAGGSYALLAEIIVDGKVWFASPEPVGLDPLASDPVLLLLARAPAEAGMPADVPEGLAGPWRAVTIDGVPVAEDVDSTFLLGEAGVASGLGACNRYSTTARLDGDSISLSGLRTTLMACASVVLTEQERRFLAALGSARRWVRDGDMLTFLGADGQEVLRFEPGARQAEAEAD